jgi:hypothetical protein
VARCAWCDLAGFGNRLSRLRSGRYRDQPPHARARAEISVRLHAGSQPPLLPGKFRRQARPEGEAGGTGDRHDPQHPLPRHGARDRPHSGGRHLDVRGAPALCGNPGPVDRPLSRHRGVARAALREIVESIFRRSVDLHGPAGRCDHQCRARACLRQGSLRAPIPVVLPHRRDERVAPTALVPDHAPDLHAAGDARAAAGPCRAVRERCAHRRRQRRRLRDDLFAGEPDRAQRAGAFVPHARFFRAAGHADRSARAGEPAARHRGCAGCAASK